MTAIPPTDSDPVVDAMTRVSLPQPVCTKGRSVMGVSITGRRSKVQGPCNRWSCSICRIDKAALATAGPRKHLKAGGMLWMLELPDTDEPDGAALRERLCGRASKARAKLLLANDPDPLMMPEYLCIRRPGESLFIASVNLGGGRKPPSWKDFSQLDDGKEFERLTDRWFRPDGLRESFAVPGTSDLRTSASRAWSQVAQHEKLPTGWKPVGSTRADIEYEVWAEWSWLMRSLCPANVCYHQDDEDSHGLGQAASLEGGREAITGVDRWTFQLRMFR
jgi:hypothetical protein